MKYSGTFSSSAQIFSYYYVINNNTGYVNTNSFPPQHS